MECVCGQFRRSMYGRSGLRGAGPRCRDVLPGTCNHDERPRPPRLGPLQRPRLGRSEKCSRAAGPTAAVVWSPLMNNLHIVKADDVLEMKDGLRLAAHRAQPRPYVRVRGLTLRRQMHRSAKRGRALDT
jgi:hypothetical protein